MTVYCILGPDGNVVPDSTADSPAGAWMRALNCKPATSSEYSAFRSWQADSERDGYTLGRADGVVFERVGP